MADFLRDEFGLYVSSTASVRNSGTTFPTDLDIKDKLRVYHCVNGKLFPYRRRSAKTAAPTPR